MEETAPNDLDETALGAKNSDDKPIPPPILEKCRVGYGSLRCFDDGSLEDHQYELSSPPRPSGAKKRESEHPRSPDAKNKSISTTSTNSSTVEWIKGVLDTADSVKNVSDSRTTVPISNRNDSNSDLSSNTSFYSSAEEKITALLETNYETPRRKVVFGPSMQAPLLDESDVFDKVDLVDQSNISNVSHNTEAFMANIFDVATSAIEGASKERSADTKIADKPKFRNVNGKGEDGIPEKPQRSDIYEKVRERLAQTNTPTTVQGNNRPTLSSHSSSKHPRGPRATGTVRKPTLSVTRPDDAPERRPPSRCRRKFAKPETKRRSKSETKRYSKKFDRARFLSQKRKNKKQTRRSVSPTSMLFGEDADETFDNFSVCASGNRKSILTRGKDELADLLEFFVLILDHVVPEDDQSQSFATDDSATTIESDPSRYSMMSQDVSFHSELSRRQTKHNRRSRKGDDTFAKLEAWFRREIESGNEELGQGIAELKDWFHREIESGNGHRLKEFGQEIRKAFTAESMEQLLGEELGQEIKNTFLAESMGQLFVSKAKEFGKAKADRNTDDSPGWLQHVAGTLLGAVSRRGSGSGTASRKTDINPSGSLNQSVDTPDNSLLVNTTLSPIRAAADVSMEDLKGEKSDWNFLRRTSSSDQLYSPTLFSDSEDSTASYPSTKQVRALPFSDEKDLLSDLNEGFAFRTSPVKATPSKGNSTKDTCSDTGKSSLREDSEENVAPSQNSTPVPENYRKSPVTKSEDFLLSDLEEGFSIHTSPMRATPSKRSSPRNGFPDLLHSSVLQDAIDDTTGRQAEDFASTPLRSAACIKSPKISITTISGTGELVPPPPVFEDPMETKQPKPCDFALDFGKWYPIRKGNESSPSKEIEVSGESESRKGNQSSLRKEIEVSEERDLTGLGHEVEYSGTQDSSFLSEASRQTASPTGVSPRNLKDHLERHTNRSSDISLVENSDIAVNGDGDFVFTDLVDQTPNTSLDMPTFVADLNDTPSKKCSPLRKEASIDSEPDEFPSALQQSILKHFFRAASIKNSSGRKPLPDLDDTQQSTTQESTSSVELSAPEHP